MALALRTVATNELVVLFLNPTTHQAYTFQSVGNEVVLLPANRRLDVQKLKGMTAEKAIRSILDDYLAQRERELKNGKEDLARSKKIRDELARFK